MGGGHDARPVGWRCAIEPASPAAAEALGARVRTLRLARGLTLVRLADSSGLSHPFLSQIERGRARPSIASLERIALALGSSVVELLAPATERATAAVSRVQRADEGVAGPYGLGTARMLGADLLTLVPLEVRGTNTERGPMHVHDEDEFLFVLAGRARLDLADRVHDLGPGDSAVVLSGTPHRWCSADGEEYRILVVKEATGIARLRADVRRETDEMEGRT